MLAVSGSEATQHPAVPRNSRRVCDMHDDFVHRAQFAPPVRPLSSLRLPRSPTSLTQCGQNMAILNCEFYSRRTKYRPNFRRHHQDDWAHTVGAAQPDHGGPRHGDHYQMQFFNPLSSVKDQIGAAIDEDRRQEQTDRQRIHHDQADLGQHGHRTGVCLRAKGLWVDPDDTGHHDRRAPRPVFQDAQEPT